MEVCRILGLVGGHIGEGHDFTAWLTGVMMMVSMAADVVAMASNLCFLHNHFAASWSFFFFGTAFDFVL